MSRKKKWPRMILDVQELESRVVPAWSPLGPAPQLNGQQNSSGFLAENVTGRITSLAIATDANGLPALYAGGAGGVWASEDFTSNAPTWAALTDNVAAINPQTGLGANAIDVGTIAVDPTNPGV